MARLTEKLAADAEAKGKPYFLWDDKIHGFGLKVAPTGHKAFVLQYRLGGRSCPARRLTIGRHGNLTATQARQIAQEMQLSIARDIDPGPMEKALIPLPKRLDLPPKSRSAARIAAVAKRIFLRDGYRASLDRIAEGAGVTKRTLYNHFENKEALFRAVVDDFMSETLQPVLAVERRVGVRETLTVYLTRYVATVTAPDSIAFYRLLVIESRAFPDLAMRGFIPVSSRLVGVLVDFLAEEIAAGRMLPLDPLLAAERLLGGVAGPIRLPALLGLPGADPGRLKRAIDEAVDTFIRGMGVSEINA